MAQPGTPSREQLTKGTPITRKGALDMRLAHYAPVNLQPCTSRTNSYTPAAHGAATMMRTIRFLRASRKSHSV